MEKQGGRSGRRVVMMLYPFQGHMNPMLQLATILHSKGFSITIVHTQFNSPNPSNFPDFTFLPISDRLSDCDLWSSFPGLLSALQVNCEAPFQQCLERMMEEEEPLSQIACIIYDGLMHFVQNVANHLKLPRICVHTNAAATMLVFGAFARQHQQGYISFQDSMSQDLVPELHPLRFRDRPSSSTETSTNEVVEVRAAVTDAMKTSAAIIVNTMHCLEEITLSMAQEYYPVPIFCTGPFHKYAPASSSSLLKEDTSCITWLDKQASKSVIYISFGSLASIDVKELLETAWGLAKSDQPFLWVVRPGSVRGSEWIELLPEGYEETVRERGCIVKWAPQKEVLAHGAVGGFWSHCGWNSTLESICEGVPMLCRPFFGDQGLNARYVSHVWKVGLELGKELERGDIERGLRRLMVDKEGEEMRQRAMGIKEEAELCLRSGGSSYNSLSELVEYILSL